MLSINAINSHMLLFYTVPETYRNKLWLFTKIPGTSLMFQGKKTLPVLVTRSRCAEQCLLETEFQCLSASFIASHKNNIIRYDLYIRFLCFLIICVFHPQSGTVE